MLTLTDQLAADAELGTDLHERPGPPVGQAEAESEDPPFAPREGVEDGVELLFEKPIAGGVEGAECAPVLDEVAEHLVALLARRLLE